MSEEKVYAVPNQPTPGRPVIIDAKVCTGCNNCVEACPVDVFIPAAKKGDSPIILFPDECWYAGCCVAHCPVDGAIRLNHPLMQRVRYKRKATGEHFRI